MTSALYARVSTQRQENEETIETQIMAVRDYAAKNGHTLIKTYKDEGWSGMILARPNLDELRLDARKKLWEAVIIYDPDRLARKYAYQQLVIDELEEEGIKVLFVTTPPAKTEEDKLLYGVKGIFAEYERARIVDRFRLGKLRKARDGHVLLTEAPYGYDYIPKQGQKNGYLKINKKEEQVIKMIFQWIGNDSYTLRGVVKKLQELGIPPRKSKRGVWNTSTLGTMLRNETYIGNARYNRSIAIVPEKPLKIVKYKKIKKTSRKLKLQSEWINIPNMPQIIDKKLFEKTRLQLKSNFEHSKRNRKNEYLLSGVIYCFCGRKRTGEGPQHGKHLYYRCTDRVYRFPNPAVCLERGINARIADQLVWDGIKRFMCSSTLIKKQVDRLVSKTDQMKERAQGSSESLIEALKEIKKEEQRYIRIYGAELISLEQFEDVIKDLKTKRASLEKQISHFDNAILKDDIILPSHDTIDRFINGVKNAFENLAFDSKQRIIRRCINKIIANQEEMTVYGYLSLEKEVEFCASSRNSRSS